MRLEFLDIQRIASTPIVIVDIPLLFEIGGEREVDIIVVVSASEETQKRRVLGRKDMSVEKFEVIKSKQLPSEEKESRAHFVVTSEYSLENTRMQIHAFIRSLH